MFVLAINHMVADYDRWKAGYDAMTPVSRGAAFARVNRSVDDANTITVVAGFDSLDTLRSFVSDPSLKEAMQAAGVSSEPRIEIYEEVEVI